MKNRERRPRSNSKTAGGPGFVRRWLDALGEVVNPRQLVPVPVAAPTSGPFRRRDPDPISGGIHRVFGRRKEEGSKDEAEQTQVDADQGGVPDATDDPEPFGGDIPPIPSGLSSENEGGPDVHSPEPSAPAEPTWARSLAEPGPIEPSPFSYEPPSDQPDLPAWSPSSSPLADLPAFNSEVESPAATPWGGSLDDADDELTSYSPVTPGPPAFGHDQAWPTASTDSPWPVGHDDESLPNPFVSSSFSDEEEEEPDDEEGADESELAEVAASATSDGNEDGVEEDEFSPSFEEHPIPEVVAVSEDAWSISTPEPEHPYLAVPPEPEPAAHQGIVALVEDARAFPLPEGEVIFRNLRSGFTDPARLLRHLAGEGHTGVMHVSGADERNTYIVLVDGYVVAVASDVRGRLTTTNRVSFPNFPNSQDTLNVISYEREIARGLGLLLHAPVHFRGLGAMFVNLDGLRSYLSKRSASGGMVVQSDTGTGVALFDDGRLVGVYSGTGVPNTDLAPLRELVKDLDAEIDVRFGGPKDLDPISLDTLLAGYPL